MSSLGLRPRAQTVNVPFSLHPTTTSSRQPAYSFYQECYHLRAKLLQVSGFAQFLPSQPTASDAMQQVSNPVVQLWDCFSLGVSLCYLCNLLPSSNRPLHVSEDPILDEKSKKRAIAAFVMCAGRIDPRWERLTVSDLWNDRSSLDGFMKVIRTVSQIIDILPRQAFVHQYAPVNVAGGSPLLPRSPLQLSPLEERPSWMNIVQQIVDSERKYVQDLEVMQTYAESMRETVGLEMANQLLPNFGKLLNFQRWFLIGLETIASLSRAEQRWGLCFVEKEADLSLQYEHYCSNYLDALRLVHEEEEALKRFDKIISAKSELPVYLVKPVHRILTYPLLLESLLRTECVEEYPHLAELQLGAEAAKRVADDVSQAQTLSKALAYAESHVEDWKGHHPSNWGHLLLHAKYPASGASGEVEHHFYMFQQAILVCMEIRGPKRNTAKVGKGYHFRRKKASSEGHLVFDKPNATSLLINDVIPIADITHRIPSIVPDAGTNTLSVSWQRVTARKEAVLQFRTQGQLDSWVSQLDWLRSSAVRRRRAIRGHTSKMQPLGEIITQKSNEILLRAASWRTSQSTQESVRDSVLSYYFQNPLQLEYDPTHVNHNGDQDHPPPSGIVSSPLTSSFISAEDTVLSILAQDEDKTTDSMRNIEHVRSIADNIEAAEAMSALTGDAAAEALDDMQDALDILGDHDQNLSGQLAEIDSRTLVRRQIRRLLLKLSRKSGVLPPCLFISGVNIEQKHEAVCLGGFADVYRGTLDGSHVAIKRLRVTQSTQHRLSVHWRLCKEALLWRQLRHPFILPFIGVDRESFAPFLCMVSPWLANGNVLNYIEYRGIREVEVERLLFEVAQGTSYLHKEGVVHGDLRGNNILIDTDHHARLADFGLTAISDATVGTFTGKGAGSTRWMAPELLDPDCEFLRTPATDVYSYGCVCWELYTLSRPFPNIKHDVQVLFHVVSGGRLSRPTPDECPGRAMPNAVWDLVTICWLDEPENRPNMDGITEQMGSIV